jgi:hypothetical protein
MSPTTHAPKEHRSSTLPVREIRMVIAALIGLPAVARAFQLLDVMPSDIALYWMIAPLIFTVWVVVSVGRNVWLEVGGWAALTTASFYVLQASLAVTT